MKRIKIIIIFSVIIIAIAGGLIAYNVINRFEYNEDNVTGNTTGNLYNEGLFCEYEDYVYFSNLSDNGALYRMNKEGTEFEKLFDDNTSYIYIIIVYITKNLTEHKIRISFFQELYMEYKGLKVRAQAHP